MKNLKNEFKPKQYKYYLHISPEYVVLNCTREELIDIQNEMDKIEEYNNKVEQYNNELLSSCYDILDVTPKDKKNIIKVIKKVINDIKSEIKPSKPSYNSVFFDKELDINISNIMFKGDNLVNIYDKIQEYLETSRQINKKHEEINKLNKELALNLYKTKYSDSIIPKDVLVDIIIRKEKEEFFNKYVDGVTFELDKCPDCGQWIGGDYRCTCGNVRVNYDIEGDLVSGFYVNAS